MDTIEALVVKVFKWSDKKKAKEALTFFMKVLQNIRDHPGEDKYLHLSTKNAAFSELMSHEECVAIFLHLGFRKRVVQFKEEWYIQHVSAIDMARFNDITSLINEYNEKIYVPEQKVLSAYALAKERKAAHEKRINDILFQAEQDRIEVAEKHEKFMKSLPTRGTKLGSGGDTSDTTGTTDTSNQ